MTQNNEKISAIAYGKINLYLDILSKMENGYHSIESVMQSVSLGDKITLEVLDVDGDNQIEIKTQCQVIPNDKSNLVYKTASAFLERTNTIGKRLIFEIEKNIPISAGMAGGSSDGATAMKLLNEYFGSPLTLDELCEIGARIGADIPFCLTGGTCICQGIGERITRLTPLKDMLLVCAIDNSSVSTPVAFSMLDEKFGTRPMPHGALEKMKLAIEGGNISEVSSLLYNKFEDVIIPKIPSISKIKEIMTENGANGTLMSGSGPSVFGIFDNEKSQIKAYNALKNCSIRAFLCKTI
ncbi:MAG: 4-(cytidine 5'-diphospho)-2-C-methyl-D-erythritol kinase [Clostridia bacterium]|nr:4-(cytidine 5'-diphospho)-2-C-methyl-D-erythritol kinase [Clostridia bacterium]